MPHIHVERRPQRKDTLAILAIIVLLLAMVAIAWYFLAGPGKLQISSLGIASTIGELFSLSVCYVDNASKAIINLAL